MQRPLCRGGGLPHVESEDYYTPKPRTHTHEGRGLPPIAVNRLRQAGKPDLQALTSGLTFDPSRNRPQGPGLHVEVPKFRGVLLDELAATWRENRWLNRPWLCRQHVFQRIADF